MFGGGNFKIEQQSGSGTIEITVIFRSTLRKREKYREQKDMKRVQFGEERELTHS